MDRQPDILLVTETFANTLMKQGIIYPGVVWKTKLKVIITTNRTPDYLVQYTQILSKNKPA